MTESEWLECTDPTPMLEYVDATFSERKVRAFLIATARTVWPRMNNKVMQNAVLVAERHIEQQADSEELMNARHNLVTYMRSGRLPFLASLMGVSIEEWSSLFAASHSCVSTHNYISKAAIISCWPSGLKLTAPIILREIIGNPFRPLTINPALLNPTVLSLAQSAYDERIMPSGELEPARLAVLSDALEEAGCDNENILSHLRGKGPHVRGCWVLDLLLGKE